MGRRGHGTRRGDRPAQRRIGVAVAAVGLLWLLAPDPVGATASRQTDEVSVEVQLGVAGVVTNSPRIPVRVTLTSPSSRTVRVDLDNMLGHQFYDVELNATAPAVLDAVVQVPASPLDVTVRDLKGKRLGARTAKAELDPATVVVGVGASIAGRRDPWKVETIAGIQSATLVPLTRDLLDRPGVLDAMAGLVLGPDDISHLTDAQSRRIGAWVAIGGNLALDQARTDPLPVLGVAAEGGDRTAVEGGWVRFTGGRAASGSWSDVIEPAPVPDLNGGAMSMVNNGAVNARMGMGDGFNVFDEQLRNTGLIQISYISSGVIVATVFITSLLVGPVLWFALRNRRGRRWMWVLAPASSITIAALLATIGQGALSDALTMAIGGGVSTAWSTAGDFGVGLTSDQTSVDVGVAGQIWASSPRVAVTGSGSDRRAEQDLGANGFGYVGVGGVDVADEALVAVTATPTATGKVQVEVTNHSDLALTSVTVSGFTRSRQFDDVGPGASKTLAFETADGLSAFSALFPPAQNANMNCFNNFCVSSESSPIGRVMSLSNALRGRVEIHGVLVGQLDIAGHRHDTTMQVVARAPVSAPAEGASPSASLRIESVGTPMLPGNNNGVVAIPGGPVGPVDVPTTAAVAIPSPDELIGGSMSFAPAPSADPVTSFALMSSPVDRADLRCAVHTVVNAIDEWRDGAWVPVPIVGEPGDNPNFGLPRETRDFQFSPLAAGESRFLRLSNGLAVFAASAILCGGTT